MAGVEPEHQARGLGAKIMRRLHELIDARGVVCCLECVGDKNRAVYEQLGHQRKG